MEYEHKGTKISFDEKRAEFSAFIGVSNKRSASLAAIKKQIDAAILVAFEPFAALDYDTARYGGKAKITKFNVTGIQKTGARAYAGLFKFITDDPESYRRNKKTVVKDTPEARTAIENYQRIDKENSKEISKLEEQMKAARDAIPVLTADKFNDGLKK